MKFLSRPEIKLTLVFSLLLLTPLEIEARGSNSGKTASNTAKKSSTQKKGPSKLELAKQVFSLSGTEKEVEKVAGQLIKTRVRSSKMAILARFLHSQKIPPEKFDDALRQVLEKDIDIPKRMNQIFAQEYARSFSEAELKELVTYYKSPTGRKGIKIGKDFTKEIVQLKQSVLTPKINLALKKALEE